MLVLIAAVVVVGAVATISILRPPKPMLVLMVSARSSSLFHLQALAVIAVVVAVFSKRLRLPILSKLNRMTKMMMVLNAKRTGLVRQKLETVLLLHIRGSTRIIPRMVICTAAIP